MKKIRLILLIPIVAIITLATTTNDVSAATTDELYSQIDDNGYIIDGNKKPINYDKTVIRPSYLGTPDDYLTDYIGPFGPFKGFVPINREDFQIWQANGQQYGTKYPSVVRRIGYHNNRPLALKIVAIDYPNYNSLMGVQDNGALVIEPNSGMEFRLVYDDGVYNTPVEDVYVELPIVFIAKAKKHGSSNSFSYTAVKESNLLRFFLNENSKAEPKVDNRVDRKVERFNNPDPEAAGGLYLDSLRVFNEFTGKQGESVTPSKSINQIIIFDNSEPLLISNTLAVGDINANLSLFVNTMKTPSEINYLPPESNGTINTDKFEVTFDIIQTLNDGYTQNYPESLSLVMWDDEKMFNKLKTTKIKFTDKSGRYISNTKTESKEGDKVEFKVSKQTLIGLGSNQIRMQVTAEDLNLDAVKKHYNVKEDVYDVPVKFYNYKVQKKGDKEKASASMTAIAKIRPMLYGEPNENAKALQYTKSSDLDVNTLVKNVASTLPSSNAVTKEILDKNILFDKVQPTTVRVKLSVAGMNNSKIVSVPVTVEPQKLITRADFDNQTWLINEVQKQTGKNIDDPTLSKRIFESDLLKITSITKPAVSVRNEYIPKGIKLLKNLESLTVTNNPYQLTGNLPNELGDLNKLTSLTLSGHNFSGGIPVALTKLDKLNKLNLSNNNLSGTIPNGVETLTSLKSISLNDNKLVGSLKEYKLGPYSIFNISNTQLTYNSKSGPSFIKDYQKTFIASATNLSLKAVDALPITQFGMKIKPFDPANIGFFDLHAVKSDKQREALYAGHTFKIIKKSSGAILYNGEADPSKIISVDPDETYTVIMDDATNNPNNSIDIESVVREYRIDNFPKTFALNLKIGDLSAQQLMISSKDNLSIFDNRINSKWELKVKPSELKSKTKTLKGNYHYTTKKGRVVAIPSNASKTIESGNSVPTSGTINISTNWDNKSGLFYEQLVTNNYKDSYTGNLEWQLVDAPS